MENLLRLIAGLGMHCVCIKGRKLFTHAGVCKSACAYMNIR